VCACLALVAGEHPNQDYNRDSVLRLFCKLHDTARVAALVGLSRRRVQQILAEEGLSSKSRLRPTHPRFEELVTREIGRRGRQWGYKLLLGALRSQYPDWRWPREAVQSVLRAANPQASDARSDWCHRRIKRGTYYAPHYMASMHIDLACKLQEYRIFVAVAIDGRTRLVHRLTALADKLPVTVYEEFFAPLADEYSLPDQVITDKGREWVVLAFVCFLLARRNRRRTSGREPHRCVPSTRNVRSPPVH